MLSKGDLQEILQLALSKGGDFADIFIEEKRTVGIACEANKIERINTGIDTGAGIRAVSGDTTAYAYTNDLSKEGLSEIARVVSSASQSGKKDVSIDLREVKALCIPLCTPRPPWFLFKQTAENTEDAEI